MKTDYFLTFLDTLNNRTSSAGRLDGPALSARAPTLGTSVDIDLILKTLRGQTNTPLVQLLKTTDSSPGTLIPAIQQLQSFGLVDYDASGVSLTPQGAQAAEALIPTSVD